MEITLMVETKKAVSYLKAECGVRYWEDAKVNGVADEDGNLIPKREGDLWQPIIDLATGKIVDWPQGTEADVHYKVCDAGRYALLDADMQEVIGIESYVPAIMCPEGNGYGDYVIMKIDGTGQIAKWEVDLSPFTSTD